ncbi:MAG: hypothetical protein ACOYD9_02465 [Pyramidobacter sp.]|jgi:hypothetical protein
MLLSPSRADCIVFGVDGVLVDGSEALPAAAATCLSLCWGEKLKLGDGQSPDLTPYVRLAQDSRALNTPGDVVWGLLALSAASGKSGLAEALPSAATWERTLKTAAEPSGSGFFASRAVMDRAAVNDLYWQIYTAPATFNDEGIKVGGGIAGLEKPLFTRRWDQLSLPVGIFTTRSRSGLAAALATLGWEDFPMDRALFGQTSSSDIDSLCRAGNASWPLCIGANASAESRLMERYGKGDFIVIGTETSTDTPHFSSTADALRAILGVV